MGKIKIATLGSEEEEKLREKQKVRREEKKKREKADKVHISGMKGGQRVKAVGSTDEAEIEKLVKLAKEVEKDQSEGLVQIGAEGVKAEDKKEKPKKVKVRIRSSRYKSVMMKIDHNKLYSFSDAIPLLRQISLTHFDGSVELHINSTEKGLRGTVQLPHGTGKQIKVAIADSSTIDKLLEAIEKGKIDFHALVAHPQVMGKLARVAKFLGPRGLMPNPKNGTISPEPEKVAKKLQGGEINWKTESDFPIIHQVIGKLSFKDDQLTDNFKALIKSIGSVKIKNMTLKSTMSPGIKILLT